MQSIKTNLKKRRKFSSKIITLLCLFWCYFFSTIWLWESLFVFNSQNCFLNSFNWMTLVPVELACLSLVLTKGMLVQCLFIWGTIDCIWITGIWRIILAGISLMDKVWIRLVWLMIARIMYTINKGLRWILFWRDWLRRV